jgi:hypothetical protein
MAKSGFDEWDIERSGLRSISSPEIKRFWDGYVARRKDGSIDHGSLYSRWRRVSDDLVISLYLTNRSVGLFVGLRARPRPRFGREPARLRGLLLSQQLPAADHRSGKLAAGLCMAGGAGRVLPPGPE